MNAGLTHLSLFSGIGGIDLAAEWAGFTTIGQVEQNPYALRILRKRFGRRIPRWTDIRDLSASDFKRRTGIDSPTIITGGFPCQPHSLSGNRQGFCDERDLWPELRRVLCEIKPRWFLGENVPGIRSSNSGKFFNGVLRDLAEEGYNVAWDCWGADHIGAPHHRERVWILAHTDSDRLSQSKLRETPHRTKRDAKPSFEPLLFPTWPPGPGSQSDIPRMVDGVPHRVDRLRCLGNAVVPQQVYPILAGIAQIEKEVKPS